MIIQKHKNNLENLLSNPELSARIRTFGLIKIENSLGFFEENQKTQSTSTLLLKYLIANYNRSVSKEELFELFWPDNPDPSNALRVWMGRLRVSFTHMNLNGPRGLVISSSGYYRLNPNYVDQIDCVRIDQIAAQLSMADQATLEGLQLCKEALELYQGDYLENTEAFPWLQKHRAHYRETFNYIANIALDHIGALNNTTLLPLLIDRATAFIPKNDFFHNKLAAFQRTLQTQDNLAYFRSTEQVVKPFKNDVYIRMFGPLELENQYGRVIDPETLRYPSNSWLLLKYLLKNRGREVSQVELMEKFWPDELTSENADGTLRTRLSRLRKELKPLHLDGRNGLVLFSSGFYSINSDYTVHTDEDTFVQLMAQISNIPVDDPKGLALCVGALDLFRDRFLACTQAHPWLNGLQTHYNQEFCRLAYSTLERMKSLNNFRASPLLCRRALAVVPKEAVLHLEIITLLTEKGLLKELAQYISALSQHEGEGFEWLESTAPLSDASVYIKSDRDIRVRMFGPLELENQCGRVSERQGTYRWLLLKYLLANPDRVFSAQELETSLWADKPNNNPVIAQRELHRRLREALTPLKLGGHGLVLMRDDFYNLNPKYNLITDKDILDRITTQLQSIPVENPFGLQLCSEALRLFRGPYTEYSPDPDQLIDRQNYYDNMFHALARSSLERMKTLATSHGIAPLWQSAVAYAPGDKELHMEILTYIMEQNLPIELVPYICSLARHDGPETEWFHHL